MLLIRADFGITSLSNNSHVIRISVHWYISLGIGQFQQRTEPRHTAVYWPGLQGLVSDPLAWRARLHTCKFNISRILHPLLHIEHCI